MMSVMEHPFIVVKDQPQLWIGSVYQPEIIAGWPATFTLNYGNLGGYESAAWIINEFPPEALFADAAPYPDNVAPDRLGVRWNLGGLATDARSSIVVTVSVTSALPTSSTVTIWDGIFNHVGELQDETFITAVSGRQIYLPLVMRLF